MGLLLALCNVVRSGELSYLYAPCIKIHRHIKLHKYTILLLMCLPPGSLSVRQAAGRSDFRDNLCLFIAQTCSFGDDFRNLGVELHNINFLPRILLFHIS